MIRLLLIVIISSLSQLAIAQDSVSYSEKEIKNHSSFLDAKISLFKRDTIDAIKSLESLLKTDQKSMAAYLLSKVYDKQNKISEAINYGLKVVNSITNEEGYLLHMLQLYAKSYDTENYQTTLLQLIQRYPDNDGYFYKLVDDHIKNKTYKQALKLLNKRAKEEGVKEEIAKRKYDIYMSQQKTKKAEKTLLSLLEKYPEEIVYLYNIASFYSQTSQLEKAKKIYQKILILNPDDKTAVAILSTTTSDNSDVEVLNGMIPVVDNPDSNVDDVIKRLLNYIDNLNKEYNKEIAESLLMLSSKLSKSHPNDAKANTIYGDILYLNGQLEESKVQYIKTINITKSVFSVWNQLFSVLSRLEDYNSLVEYTNQALNYYPNQPSSYIYHSIGLAMTDKSNKAISSLEDAKFMLSSSDNYTKQLHKIAQIIIDLKLKNEEKAMNSLAEFEDNKDSLSYEILEKLAEIFLMTGDETKSTLYKQYSIDAGNLYKK